VKYAWMREHRDSFPLSVMCQVLEVSTSGYYDAQDRAPSPRAERHARIQQAVRQVHAESQGIYMAARRLRNNCGSATTWKARVATPWPARCNN
jgi:putative transposase